MTRPLNPSVHIWLHIAGIVLFLSMPILFSPDLWHGNSLFQIRPFQREFFSYVLLVCFFYVNYLWLIPKLYFQKKHILFWLIIIACLAIITFVPHWLFPKMPRVQPIGNPAHQTHRGFSFMFIFHNIVFVLAILFLAFTLKMRS